jgi:uncharacterized protein
MANRQGDFLWYELMTSDAGAAEEFYRAVVGWTAHGFDESMRGYRAFTAGDTDIAGLMTIPPDAASRGARPAWLGYVAVDDVDDTARAIIEAGGKQYVPPTDIPGVGRFAMFADPQGANFYIMRGASGEESKSFSPDGIGHCQWNELATSDQAGALAFYTGTFGWERGDSMPMGEMGDYVFINQHGGMIGAVMNTMPGAPPPLWRFYLGVDDIDRAMTAATDRGATIHYGPVEIPGGAYALSGADPQGAIFSLVGPRKG